MSERVNTRLAEATRRVLDEHGLTDRGQRARTGLAHVTVGNMLKGYDVQMDTLVNFARGFGLDINDWLELGGYEPIQPADIGIPAPTAFQRLQQGVQDLCDETAGDWQWFIHRMTPDEKNALTAEQAEADLDEMRSTLQRRPAPDFFLSPSGRISAWDAKKHPLGFPLPEDQRKPTATLGENPGDRFVRFARDLVAACKAVNVPPPPAINWSYGTTLPDVEKADQVIRELVDQHAREYPEHAAVYRMWLLRSGLDEAE